MLTDFQIELLEILVRAETLEDLKRGILTKYLQNLEEEHWGLQLDRDARIGGIWGPERKIQLEDQICRLRPLLKEATHESTQSERTAEN